MAPCVCRACPSTDQTCPARVLFLAHPGGVAEQFGHGNGDPLGVPSTWGGMQPASLPAACGSTVTFGGARLNWGGGLVCFCYPRPCCHPAPPTRGEGDMGGAQLLQGSHSPPRQLLRGNLVSHAVHGGLSISCPPGDGRAMDTGSITCVDGAGGLSPPLRVYELPSRAWSALAPAAWVSPRLHFPGVVSEGYWLQSHLSSCPKIFSSRYMSLIHAG